jgi:hypothetical protein
MRFFQSSQEPFFLLFFRNIKEELENNRPVFLNDLYKMIDLIESFLLKNLCDLLFLMDMS